MPTSAPRRTTRAKPISVSRTAPEFEDGDIDYRAADSIGFLMRVTLRGIRRMLRACLAAEGLTMSVWFYLRVLWEEDGLTQRELTERVGFMQPTSVNALKALERDGLVRLTRDRHDRRKIRIFLTPEGRRLKRRLLPRVAHINDQIALSGFSGAEVEALREFLARIKANVDRHLAGGNGAGKNGQSASLAAAEPGDADGDEDAF